VGVRDAVALGNRATQRKLALSMVGNVIMMLVLVVALTLGGFLLMDYKTEEARAKKIDKRVAELRRQFEQDCRKKDYE
jgi:type VI protein secretion system component VasK